MRITNVFVASCLIGTASVANAGDPTISVSGDCPGAMMFQWEGATANRTAGLCYSEGTGTFLLPGPPCGGTFLGLGPSGIRLVRAFATGMDGAGRFRAHAASQACGGYLQMIVVDEPDCPTSNVVQIPQ